MGDAG